MRADDHQVPDEATCEQLLVALGLDAEAVAAAITPHHPLHEDLVEFARAYHRRASLSLASSQPSALATQRRPILRLISSQPAPPRS